MNRRGLEEWPGGFVAEEVVNAPAAVEFSGAASIGPPGIGALNVAVMFSNQVVPARLQQFSEPFSFVWHESRSAFVGLGVEDVLLGVSYINVPTEDKRVTVMPSFGPSLKLSHPFFFDRLTFRAGRAGRKINAGEMKALNFDFQ